MTIIITSRTGYFPVESIATKIKFMKYDVPMNLSCHRLVIAGIDKNSRKKYLAECLRKSPDKFISMYASLLEFSLLKYPKILIMVGEIIYKLPEDISETTPIYANLLQFLVQRYTEKNQEECQAKKDSQDTSVKGILQDMGEYALSNILETDMRTNNKFKEIRESMCASGILIKNANEEYEPFHQSLVDYLTAFYLYNLFLSSKQLFQRNIINLMPIVFQLPSDSMIFLFLVGLLDRDASVLLQLIQKYEFKIRSFFEMLLGILSELKIDGFKFTSLHPFIPKVWKIPWTHIKTNFTESSLHSMMIQSGVQKKRIMIIDWDLTYKCSYPKNIVVDKLIIRLKDQVNNCYKDTGLKMHCQELLCLIYSCNEENFKKIWNDFFNLLQNITYKHISFQIWTHLHISHLNMKSMVCENWLMNKLLCFQCQIHSDKGYFKNHSEDEQSKIYSDGYYNNNDIILIIKSNKLKIIHLAFHGEIKYKPFQTFVETILRSVAISSNIDKLVLLNKTSCNCDIDLKLLSNNGERSFSYVWFVGFSIKCDDEQDEWKLNIKNFTHWKYAKASPVQFEKRVIGTEIVAIEGELLCEEAVNNAEHFNKFLNNLRELDTTLGRSVYEEDILKHVQKCSNLQILYLTTTSLASRCFPKAVTQFINVLSLMKSVHTLMIWHGEENFPFHISLFKELKKQNSSNKLRKLRNLKFTCNIHNQNDESFNHLSNIMEIFGDLVIQEWIEGYISVVTQIGSDMLQETKKFFDIIEETLLPRDELIIKSDFDGSSDEECCYSHRYFLVGKLQESFIIKKKIK